MAGCPKCGAELTEDQAFCEKCGEQLKEGVKRKKIRKRLGAWPGRSTRSTSRAPGQPS